FFRLPDASGHLLFTWGEHDFCTIGPEEIYTFISRAVREHENRTVSFCCSIHCKTDAGVTARRLDDGPPRFHQPGFLRFFKHRKRCTVLDALARIEHLQLDKDVSRAFWYHFIEFYNRSVPNQIHYTIYSVHELNPLSRLIPITIVYYKTVKGPSNIIPLSFFCNLRVDFPFRTGIHGPCSYDPDQQSVHP